MDFDWSYLMISWFTAQVNEIRWNLGKKNKFSRSALGLRTFSYKTANEEMNMIVYWIYSLCTGSVRRNAVRLLLSLLEINGELCGVLRYRNLNLDAKILHICVFGERESENEESKKPIVGFENMKIADCGDRRCVFCDFQEFMRWMTINDTID